MGMNRMVVMCNRILMGDRIDGYDEYMWVYGDAGDVGFGYGLTG